MMAVALWVVVGFLTVFPGVGLFVYPDTRLGKTKTALVMKLLGVCVFLVGPLSPLYYEFPSWPESVPVTMENGRIERHPFGVFAWEWGKGWANMPLERIWVTSSVTPITDNPKARKVSYGVVMELADPATYYAIVGMTGQATWGGIITDTRKDITDKTRYALFEFNEKYSKELAHFYNPLDPNQQTGFTALVIGELTPPLANYGIRVVGVKFDLD